ncbi:MAG: NAD-dependent epimerase/dehydratase family protein [Planctomycetes bacterium]|nr:NAD-dependent epimerase/dehydratase family protein [Planctomycetota bacterium]
MPLQRATNGYRPCDSRAARPQHVTTSCPTPLTRHAFLSATAAGSAAALATAAAPRLGRAPLSPRKKRILMLGGTGWLGPAVVRAGLARGHEFTLFNRGKTHADLFPDVEKLKGQRRRPRPDSKDPEQDLTALEGRKWDAVVDTSAYFTGEVEDACAALRGNVGQYVFISSLSVYPSLELDATPITEDSPRAECADKYTTSLGERFENYGALKRYGEDAAMAAFPGAATILRPGYIVGPGDGSDRFTYWPARLLRGGECLAPGAPDNGLQFVDVRDLGEWVVHLIETGTAGPFNAVGFDGSISVAEFLHTGKGTLNHRCDFTWVDDDFLEAEGVTPWEEMGCWTPKAKNGHAHNDRALAAGARFRPIAETIRDTALWVQQERGDRPWRAGMTAEREVALLNKWKAR